MSPRLQKGDIIICLENFLIPGTGVTFHFFKGYRYKITQYLPVWFEKFGLHAWRIEIIGDKSSDWTTSGAFSEDDLFTKFDCVKHLRKLKLLKLNRLINESR